MPKLTRSYFYNSRFNSSSPFEVAGHYAGLDLLRGVAAFGVLWFHCSAHLDLPGFFAHGYLAVDFFFVLSGFVMARAYCARIEAKRLSLPRFALIRATRLLPLIVLGTGLAAVIEIGRPNIVDQHRHLVDAARAVVMGSLLVPTLRSTTLELGIFPLNGPTWSLFLETVANAFFAVWARSRMGLPALAAVLGISAVGLLWGVQRYGAICFGPLPDSFWLGFARVGWSFAVGLVLFHLRHRAPRVPFAIPVLLLVAVMTTPPLGAASAAFDAACVCVVLPLVVMLASAAEFGAAGRRWSGWSGDLSYPIYALHYPLVRFFGVIALWLHLSLAGRYGLVILTTVVVSVLSALSYRFYDVPVRRWLTLGLSSVAPRSRNPSRNPTADRPGAAEGPLRSLGTDAERAAPLDGLPVPDAISTGPRGVP